MNARYVCERCGTSFESVEARCPKCLRKSTVREASDRASTEDARLARGDRSQSPAARRATALVIVLALSAALGAALVALHDAVGLLAPAIAAWVVTSIAWGRAALLDTTAELAPWAAFARRVLIGLALGTWAWVSGLLALVTAGSLSPLFTLVIGVVLFVGAIVPVLRWMQHKDEAPARATGKWRRG